MKTIVRQIHCFISGRVQGVSYRYSTMQQAHRLSVYGWVRNCSDGRVELFAEGESAAIDSLIAWLHQGPKYSQVEQVEVIQDQSIDSHTLSEFVIR